MKKILIAFTALSLASCASFPAVPDFNPQTQFAPTANKAVPALLTAWRGYEAILTAVNAMRAAGVIQDGSPRALQVANGLERSLNALNAATDAVRAGNASNFTDAMALANQAFAQTRSAIGGS